MTLNAICTSPTNRAYAPLASQDLEAAVSSRRAHDTECDTFQTVVSERHTDTPPVIFRVEHAASYPAAPSSPLAYLAKSTISGVILGATAISGMMFLSLMADKKMQALVERKPFECFVLLEAMGASIGAVAGLVIGVCHPASKKNVS